MGAAEILFWLALIVLLYTYLGYPALVFLLGRGRKFEIGNENYQPAVSLLICAYNEENCIREKVENALNLKYPQELLEIVMVSDGSTDKTDDIIRGFEDPRLKFYSYQQRGGKAKALNLGIQKVKGDIIVFTDANVIFEPDAIKRLASNFADNNVGCVVGNVKLRSPDGNISGEGIYSRYEKAVHRAEGNFATMITVDGAMYAMRKEFVHPIPEDSLTDDWYLATGALECHNRIVFEEAAVGYEDAASSVSGEFKRKVRMAAGGYQTAFRRARLFFDPVNFPKVSFMFLSHKLLRWNAMSFMILLLLANSALVGESEWFYLIFLLQAGFYCLSVLGWLFSRAFKSLPFYIPYYFLTVNWAAVVGLLKYITNSQRVTWERGRGI